jgi:predicted RNase H-like HicB family nuclease
MRETRQFTTILVLDTDEHVYTVTVPALPGVVAQAPTVEEAIDPTK